MIHVKNNEILSKFVNVFPELQLVPLNRDMVCIIHPYTLSGNRRDQQYFDRW